jgi:hypothetical protein
MIACGLAAGRKSAFIPKQGTNMTGAKARAVPCPASPPTA